MSAYSTFTLGTAGLRGYWRQNESAGPTATDSTGASNGTYTNGPTFGVTGAIPNDPETAVKYVRASSTYLTIPDVAAFHVADTFSLRIWVKRASIGQTGWLSNKGATGGTSFAVLFLSGNTWELVDASGFTQIAVSTSTITDVAFWHQLWITKSGASIHLYQDGVDVTSISANQTLASSTSPLLFATNSNGTSGNEFDGALAELALYNVAVPAATILADYQLGTFGGITHASVAVTADDGSGLEGPNEWNAAHTVSTGGIPTSAVANLSGTNTGDQTLSDATITTTDITTNNVSTSKHGFAPKAPNDATKFLNGVGAYSTPSSGGSPAAAGSLVQSIAWTTVANAGTKTWGSTPTNGNTLYAFIVTNSAIVTSLVQTNVVWTLVARTQNGGGNVGVTEIWKGVVSASASTTITFNFSGNNVQACILQEWNALTTVDAADGWFIRDSTSAATQSAMQFVWGTLGGRAFLLGQNSTGGAWTAPPGWTASTGTPFNYGGSGEGYLYSIDASSSGAIAALAQIAPVNTDNHEATFMHCTP